MVSLAELSREWDVPYKRLHRWIQGSGLGRKVGWAVILTDEEAERLKNMVQQRAEMSVRGRGRPMLLGGLSHGC